MPTKGSRGKKNPPRPLPIEIPSSAEPEAPDDPIALLPSRAAKSARASKVKTEKQKDPSHEEAINHWNETGDVEIMSSDKVHFRIDGGLLRQTSAVFADMMSVCPKPKHGAKPTVIPLAESFDLIHAFLDCFHLGEPIPNLDTAKQLMVMADKYDMVKHMRLHIILFCFHTLPDEPFEVFLIACQVKDTALIASALHSMGHPSAELGRPYELELVKIEQMGIKVYQAILKAYEKVREGNEFDPNCPWKNIWRHFKLPED